MGKLFGDNVCRVDYVVKLLPIVTVTISKGDYDYESDPNYSHGFSTDQVRLKKISYAPAGAFILGDIDENKQVDSIDLGLLLDDYRKSGGGLDADLNADNMVDARDLSLLLQNYGRTAANE